MSDMKDFLRDLGYFGVGAAALVVETGAKAVNALVRKGKKTLTDNQDTVDEIKRKAKEAGQRIKDAVEKATATPEDASSDDTPVAPDVIYQTDEPVPPEVLIPEEPIAEPVESPEAPIPGPVEIPEAPTVADAPENPEETING